MVLLSLSSCYNGNSNGNATSANPSFDDVITSRRSVRKYDASKKISEAEVRDLIKAVQDAPSWANQQPTKYYVAISPEKLAAVQDMAVTRNASRTLPYSSSQLMNVASRVSSKASRVMRSVMAGEPTTMA